MLSDALAFSDSIPTLFHTRSISILSGTAGGERGQNPNQTKLVFLVNVTSFASSVVLQNLSERFFTWHSVNFSYQLLRMAKQWAAPMK